MILWHQTIDWWTNYLHYQYEMPVEVNIVMDHMAAKMEQDRHKEYTNSAAGPFLQLC